MTNTFNKVLSVFLSVTSVVFLAFTVAYVSGGVNWQSEMNSPDLTEYNFQLSDGEEPQWTVTRSEVADANGTKALVDQQIANVPESQLAQAIVRARKDLETRQRTKLGAINTLIPEVTQQLEAVQSAQKIDLEALKKRETEVEAYLKQIHTAVLTESDNLSKRVQDTTDTRTESANRRRDVYRLTNELEVLRTDRARLVELRRELAEKYLRLQLTNHGLKQRVEQLID